MCRRSLLRLTTRIGATVKKCRRDRRGVAAIEFALIVPIMSAMFFGAVELSLVITVDRRVTRVASSTADLVARAEKQISHTEIGDIMKVGGYILEPYSQTPLEITLRNVTSTPANATTTKQSWSCTYKGLDKTQTCVCSNTIKSIPPNLLTSNDSVVVAEVSHDYKPLIFDYFMKRAAAGATSGTGVYTLTETIYLKPRSQAAMLMQPNNTPCPMPAF
jgi:Flp pilus assembly protein TadG